MSKKPSMTVERGGTFADAQQMDDHRGIFLERGKTLTVSPQLLVQYLQSIGYRQYMGEVVHVTEENIVTRVHDLDNILTVVKQSLNGFKELDAWAGFASKPPIKWGALRLLPELEGEFLKDTAKDIYIPFKNAIAHVTAAGVKARPYGDYLVWQHQRMARPIDLKKSNKLCMFKKFIDNVSGKEQLPYVQYCIGYLMHDYLNEDNARVVILYDTAKQKGNHGRTGKDVLLKAIAQIRNTVEKDAKKWKRDGDSNTYFFGNVTEETQFVKISDPNYYSIFDNLFNKMQGLFSVERKFKNEVDLKHVPKFAISSNIMFNAKNSSEKERQFPVILKPFYRDLGHPQPIRKVHGKQFYKDWTPEEWNMFYITIMECARVYLATQKVPQPDFEAINLQSFYQQAGELATFIMENIVPGNKPQQFNVYDMAINYANDNNMLTDEPYADRATINGLAKNISEGLKTLYLSKGITLTKSSIRVRANGKDNVRTIYTTIPTSPRQKQDLKRSSSLVKPIKKTKKTKKR